MRKKLFTTVMAAALALSMVACGSSTGDSGNGGSEANTGAAQQELPEAAWLTKTNRLYGTIVSLPTVPQASLI